MNVNQLIAALQKIHPDYTDQDVIIMDVDKEGKPTYSLLVYAGIVIAGDLSFPAIGSDTSVRSLAKDGRARRFDTNQVVTEADLDPPKNETE